MMRIEDCATEEGARVMCGQIDEKNELLRSLHCRVALRSGVVNRAIISSQRGELRSDRHRRKTEKARE